MLNGLFHGLSWIGLAASNHSKAMYHGKATYRQYLMQDCGGLALQL
ncbi:hypothetical protein TIFTF001_056003 [Ficus carica]|uniref:Uncharacterized protein n=1 Tax=Ficus carica TaxID=3494 RepID=A0AA88ECH3_FICCA|nr:hypothetical protein TIFTF001_056003 [Ficus carica]